MVVFQYGSAVLFNVEDHEVGAYLDIVIRHASGLLPEMRKDDLNLKSGVTIPAGAGLVVPVQLVQMDDCSWGSDANEFNPYRFLSKPGKGSDFMLNKSVSEEVPCDWLKLEKRLGERMVKENKLRFRVRKIKSSRVCCFKRVAYS